MTNLQISPAALINVILLIISIVTFVIAYNKAVKDRVDKSDLTNLRSYVDQQDRTLHNRVDETNKKFDDSVKEVNGKLDLILSHLLNNHK